MVGGEIIKKRKNIKRRHLKYLKAW